MTGHCHAVDQYRRCASLGSAATRYPCNRHEDGEISLRSQAREVSEHHKAQFDDRLTAAGVDFIKARSSHLAHASEIAPAMLQRQQAHAVVAAGMREMALNDLKAQDVVELDEERLAKMVSNPLVVLCSDRASRPVINAGSIHP